MTGHIRCYIDDKQVAAIIAENTDLRAQLNDGRRNRGYTLNEIRKATAPERIKEMWEEAKKNPSGPIPGSRVWWQARQAARAGQGGVRYDQPAPAGGAAAPAAAAPAAGAAAPAAAPAAAGGAPADETSSGHLFDSAPEDGEGSSGLF